MTLPLLGGDHRITDAGEGNFERRAIGATLLRLDDLGWHAPHSDVVRVKICDGAGLRQSPEFRLL